ncbi:MAG: hypothetical protein R2800_03945 [Flavipsychrobacter sp.]
MNRYLPLLLICILAGCGLCTDLENIQWSANMDGAKKRGVFLKRYELVSISGTETVIGEAWLEQQWYNYVKAFTIDMVLDTGYSFCFTVEKYDTTQINFHHPWGSPKGSWPIWSVDTKGYINSKYADPRLFNTLLHVRQLSLVDTVGIDTLSFILLERTWNDSLGTNVETPYGEMMFRAVE